MTTAPTSWATWAGSSLIWTAVLNGCGPSEEVNFATSASGLSAVTITASASTLPEPVVALDVSRLAFDLTVANPSDDIVKAIWTHTAPGGSVVYQDELIVETLEDGATLEEEALFKPGAILGTHTFTLAWERSDGSTSSSSVNVDLSATATPPFSVSSVTTGLLHYGDEVTLSGSGLDTVERVQVGRWNAQVTSQPARRWSLNSPNPTERVKSYCRTTTVLEPT